MRLQVLAWLFAMATSAQAAGVLSVSPLGEARFVRQVSIRFDTDMVPLGKTDGAEPAQVRCTPRTPEGRARWVTPRVWAYDFASDVSGGVRCEISFVADIKNLAGEAVTAPLGSTFVAGPSGFFGTFPPEHSEVTADQVFLIRHRDPQPNEDPQALAAQFVCEHHAAGQVVRQSAVAVSGDSLEKAIRRYPHGPYPVALRCPGLLPDGVHLRLRHTSPHSKEVTNFVFTTRPRFSGNVECTLVDDANGQKACDPRLAIRISLSAGIHRYVAKSVRLTDAKGSDLPFDVVDNWRTDGGRLLEVKPPKEGFGEGSVHKVRLLEDFGDQMGRPLANAAEFPKTVQFARLPPYLGPVQSLAVVPWVKGQPNAMATFAVRGIEHSLPLRHWRLGGELGEGIETYAIELLQGRAAGRWPAPTLTVKVGNPRTVSVATGGDAMEFVGMPLDGPGLHIVRADSAIYGKFLDTRLLAPGEVRDESPRQRYTVVQATNLNPVVSFSDLGSSLVWITSLDTARPVGGADVALYSCTRELLWRGKTNEHGLAYPGGVLQRLASCSYGSGKSDPWLVVRSGGDLTLMEVSSGWRGYGSGSGSKSLRLHTVLDRMLFKAGETLSLQLVLRGLESHGFSIPDATHLGVEFLYGRSDRVHTAWVPVDANGSANYQWQIPAGAKLGDYTIRVSHEGQVLDSTPVTIAEFRTPVFESNVTVEPQWSRGEQVARLSAGLNFFSGGATPGLPVSVQSDWVQAVRAPREGYTFFGDLDDPAPVPSIPEVTTALDSIGHAQVRLPIPPLGRPMLLRLELKFEDPNGETQTTGATTMVWPDRMKLGLRVRANGSNRPPEIEGIALDERDQPIVGEQVEIAVKPVRTFWNVRKRATDLAAATTVCSTRTDSQGKWSCVWRSIGEMNSLTPAADAWVFTATAGSMRHSERPVRTSLLEHRGNLGWRDSVAKSELQIENGPTFASGESAIILARPDRIPAHLLLTAEREGVLHSSVHEITTLSQRITIPLQAAHAPNLHVGARYAYPLLGAGQDEQISSFQQIGISIRPDSWALTVDVKPASTTARPRAKVPVEVMVRDANKQPVQGARITIAVIDQALLALRPNASWSLAKAMYAPRRNAVMTTALGTQLLRRATTGLQPGYLPADEASRGRRATAPPPSRPAAAPAPAPARAGTEGSEPSETAKGLHRTDLSSVVLWRTDVHTDTQGVARITVPLNDSLTQFRVVAIATAGSERFGEGEASIVSTQPLQILSGLPELLRSGDKIVQKVTLRNTGKTPLEVNFLADADAVPDGDWPSGHQIASPSARAGLGLLIERKVNLAAGETQQVHWSVEVPRAVAALRWRMSANGSDERDAIELTQRVVPALPVTVRQSTLLAVNEARALPVVQPRDAVPQSGGVRVVLQSSLVGGALAETMRWMSAYPYPCLEQQSSKLVVLEDRAGWDRLMGELPKYLSGNGLARYFPESTLVGSEMLTVHLLDLARARGWPIPADSQRRMLDALQALLRGRLAAQDWTPDNGIESQKLAAQATLVEYGRQFMAVRPERLDRLSAQSLVDWSRTLLAMPASQARTSDLQDASAQLRNGFDVQGSQLRWRDEAALHRWWFMWSGDSTAARLALLAQQLASTDAAWKEEAPQIVLGLVGRQKGGRWTTTIGNAWSALALRRFHQQFEEGPVDGKTTANLGTNTGEASWVNGNAPTVLLGWPSERLPASLTLRHEGRGKPWATVSVLAAIKATSPVSNGLSVRRTVIPVEQKKSGSWSVGDVYRVRLDLESTADQTWVVVHDALPSGASQLGRGLGRESLLAQRGESRSNLAWPSYIEQSTDSWRAYYRYVPRGKWHVEYVVRLNNAGAFSLPPVRVEAMYAPETFGEGLAQSMTINP